MQLTRDQKIKILVLSDEGMSGRAIAKKLGLSATTVNNLIKKHKVTGTVDHKRGNGRLQKICPRSNEILNDKISRDPKFSLRKLATTLLNETTNRVSHVTIKRHLNKNQISAHSPIKKPLLRPINIQKRKEAAKRFILMTESDAKSIIFSDESKFNLFYSDGRRFVWRTPGSGLDDRHTIKTVKHGGGSVMVWACFSYYGVGKLVFVDGKMTGAGYVDILSRNLLESSAQMGLSSFLFQQDNDPKHTSRIANEFFEANGINVITWPPQSPDLNPIEHLWALIKTNVAKRQPKNITELKRIILSEWETISIETCRKYALSFKKRALKVYEANGGHTYY